MGTYESGNTTASIQGTVNIGSGIPTGATRLQKGMYASTAGAEAQTIFTPTAGKVLYITTLTLSSDSAVGMDVGDNLASAPSADTLQDGVIASIRGNASGQTMCVSYPIPARIATALKLFSTGAGGAYVSFTGYEVTE